MMTIIVKGNTTLEKEKQKLILLEEILKNDKNEKDIKYHTLALEATKENIKRLESLK